MREQYEVNYNGLQIDVIVSEDVDSGIQGRDIFFLGISNKVYVNLSQYTTFDSTSMNWQPSTLQVKIRTDESNDTSVYLKAFTAALDLKTKLDSSPEYFDEWLKGLARSLKIHH
jgi:hypothetical protein